MGAGGRMPVNPDQDKKSEEGVQRAPVSKPPFTIGDIKKVIPPHCFKRSVLRSFKYVSYDLGVASILYYVATNYIHLLPHPLAYIAWPIYVFLQSCCLTGIWIICHDCGHHAFSDYQWLDDTVGFILHSFLLVPYFSWKYSHRRHHSNTGSIERDEVFVPRPKSELQSILKYANNPPGRFLKLVFMFTLAWPLYLLVNFSGRPYERFACHFDPNSPIYADRERVQVLVSDAGVLAVCYVLYRLAVAKGLAWVLCVYGGPLLGVNAFLVLVTFLNHTHPGLPHYNSSEWDWLRGALATVDRDYGKIMNNVLFNIPTTHVGHHLFPTIPHYNLVEVTKAVKPILGEYYRFDDTPVAKAVWREAKECLYVKQDDEADQGKGVFWFTNKL